MTKGSIDVAKEVMRVQLSPCNKQQPSELKDADTDTRHSMQTIMQTQCNCNANTNTTQNTTNIKRT